MFFHKNVTYGIKTVLYLAGLNEGVIQTSGEISRQLRIPKEYTAKVLQNLTKNGIILSKRGKNGGFYLGRNPEEIKIVDIIFELDDAASLNLCLFGFRECNLGRKCPLHDTVDELKNQFYEFIYNRSIKDIQKSGWLKY
jgi:Rrf2 family protein